MSPRRAQVGEKAGGILASIRTGVASRTRGESPVRGTGEATPGVLCLVLGPSIRAGAGSHPKKGTELGRVWSTSLRLFSLEKRGPYHSTTPDRRVEPGAGKTPTLGGGFHANLGKESRAKTLQNGTSKF
ncbi:hypothetical protein TURU_120855 [Turdus rufiventris]|nr:hypothetical protein TURU_120855 [Turdus rufiventris]